MRSPWPALEKTVPKKGDFGHFCSPTGVMGVPSARRRSAGGAPFLASGRARRKIIIILWWGATFPGANQISLQNRPFCSEIWTLSFLHIIRTLNILRARNPSCDPAPISGRLKNDLCWYGLFQRRPWRFHLLSVIFWAFLAISGNFGPFRGEISMAGAGKDRTEKG